MTAGGDAMAIHIATCADAADMRTSPDTFAADMRPDTDAQNFYLGAHGKRRDGGQDGQRKERSSEHFHRNILIKRRTETDSPA
jgi:hypothetical protein